MANLFTDPDIFHFPFGDKARPIFAAMLTRLRSKKVKAAYSAIGGRSPLTPLSEAQAEALTTVLRKRGIETEIALGMRYWTPTIRQGLEKLRASNVQDRIIILSLYPHFSFATRGSSLNELNRQIDNLGWPSNYQVISTYYDNPKFIDAFEQRITESLEKLTPELRQKTEILFSAHGLPTSFIERGDPYLTQIEATFEALHQRFPDRKFHPAVPKSSRPGQMDRTFSY